MNIKINRILDLQNAIQFLPTMLYDEHYTQNIFNCVICRKSVSLEYSTSIKGHCLVCDDCRYKYFNGDCCELHEWQKEVMNK